MSHLALARKLRGTRRRRRSTNGAMARNKKKNEGRVGRESRAATRLFGETPTTTDGS
jgi:hypothetical protein